MTKTTSATPVARVPELLSLADPLSEHLREKVVEVIVQLVDAEIDAVLGAARYAREVRGGYRHGHRDRTIATSLGPAEVALPRARVFAVGGGEEEFKSALIRRYKRRTAEVDGSILASYLSGTNTRRVRRALEPMLKGTPLGKSSVSRVVKQLSKAFDEWRTRSLGDTKFAYVFLDAIQVPVRSDRRSQSMAVLVALGVRDTGERELLGLMLAPSESAGAWKTFVEDLSARGLEDPILCVIDGHAGLRKAVGTTWASAAIQRCTVHKLHNLRLACPKQSWPDLHADYKTIVEAPSEKAARAAFDRFVRVWRLRCEPVVTSLLEAGEELLTHYRFPRAQWKALRTTNAIERLHLEFRRRIKTQGSMPNESSVLYLFYGLCAGGQVRLRKISGWRDQMLMLATRAGAAQVGPSETIAHAAAVSSAGGTKSDRLRRAA